MAASQNPYTKRRRTQPDTKPALPPAAESTPTPPVKERNPNPGIAALADVVAYTSSSVAVAAHRRKEAFEKKKAELEKARLKQSAGTSHSFRNRGAPTSALMPSPSPYGAMNGAGPSSRRDDYLGRAYLQILPLGTSNADYEAFGNMPTFEEFLITGIQGSDSEKSEVIETFGAPHLFASGRYMRKYVITGQCRLNPVSINHPSNALYRTSQFALLQRFYDQYLRATQQAQRSVFTRLSVDDEYLDGWILSLSPSRDANSEQFAHFSFTMMVRDRGSLYDTDADKVLDSFKAVRGARKAATTKAKLELADVVTKAKLQISGSPVIPVITSDQKTVEITGLRIKAIGKSGLASATLTLDQAKLKLDPSVASMRLMVGVDEELKLKIAIEDFLALQEAASADGKLPTVLTATSDGSVTTQLPLVISRLNAIKIATLSATLNGTTAEAVLTEKTLTLRTKAPLTASPLVLALSATFKNDTGATVNAQMVAKATLVAPTLQTARAVSVSSDGAGRPADMPIDASVASAVTLSCDDLNASMFNDVATWSIKLALGEAHAGLMNNPPQSPFKAASAYQFRIPLAFAVPKIGSNGDQLVAPALDVILEVPPGKTRKWFGTIYRPIIEISSAGDASSAKLSLTVPLTDEGLAALGNNAYEALSGFTYAVSGAFDNGILLSATGALTTGDVAGTLRIRAPSDSVGLNLALRQVGRPTRVGRSLRIVLAAWSPDLTNRETDPSEGSDYLASYRNHSFIAELAAVNPPNTSTIAPPTPYKAAQ